ncbi:MAG: 4'-phosphopantetheinyl transferase family protein [Psychrobacter sp.]
MKPSMVYNQTQGANSLLALKIQRLNAIDQHMVIRHDMFFLAHNYLNSYLHKISVTLLTEDFRVDKLYHYFHITLPEALTKAAKKRQLEFFAGRLSAKLALEPFGLDDAQILKGANGEPLWPQGIGGSISHTGTKQSCTALSYINEVKLQPQGIGVDIETKRDNDYFKHDTLLSHVFLNRQERARLLAREKQYHYLIVFSAKESIIKAIYDKYSILLSFLSIEFREMNDHLAEFTVIASNQHFYGLNIDVSFYFTEEDVITVCPMIHSLPIK